MRMIFGLSLVVVGDKVSSHVTFYGAKDNCPPGGDIAYPHVHQKAGGTGTWNDPVTFAGAEKAVKPGSKIYIPFLKKYAIMEDQCEECEDEWPGKWHIDVWMGPDQVSHGPELIACENALTKGSTTIWIDAPQGLEVDSTPLFDGKCIVSAPACHDVGSQCGNKCKIPKSETCDELAQMFGLSNSRFHELNKNLDCSGKVPQHTSVCMGGTCGDTAAELV
jgi:hypothetical protein